MLVQDSLTGYIHEVPETYGYGQPYEEYPETMGEGQVVYDGLGNPVGLLPFLPAIGALAAKALPLVSQALPAAAGLVRQALPAVGSMVSRLPGFLQQLIPGGQGPGAPAPPGLPFPSFPRMPLPIPPGWVPRPHPFQGMMPRRMYMRCAVWPGPRGLVPAHAAQPLGPVAPAPGAPVPGAPAPGAQPMMRPRFRRRRR